MQKLYDSFGPPEYTILEKCSINNLMTLEIEWGNNFDNLVNIQELGVQTGSGCKNPNSRYSKIKILRAFILLYKFNKSQHYVSKTLGIPRGTISHIVHGTGHLWLKMEYPEQYKKLQNNALYNSMHGWRNRKQ